MKTSVIEVRDMLSVLSVQGVEERIGEVPGVESVTVNFSAGNASVRYDETRLDISDIKSDVRQRGYDEAAAKDGPTASAQTASPTADVDKPDVGKPAAPVPAGQGASKAEGNKLPGDAAQAEANPSTAKPADPEQSPPATDEKMSMPEKG